MNTLTRYYLDHPERGSFYHLTGTAAFAGHTLKCGEQEYPAAEKAVLAVTCGLKPFARLDEARRLGLSRAQWEAASASLKARKLLNAAGAISTEGRNTVRTFPGCSLSCNYSSFAEGQGRQYHWGWEPATT